MAGDKTKKEAEGGGGLLVPLLLLLVLGGGAGFGYGLLSGAPNKPVDAHAESSKDAATKIAAERSASTETNGPSQADWRNEQLLPIQPLVVRMSGGKGRWIRLEGAVAFPQEPKQDRSGVMTQLGEDLMLFLGSTELQQIDSATGLEFLRDDMNDIVRTRTSGQARRFLLKSLVVE